MFPLEYRYAPVVEILTMIKSSDHRKIQVNIGKYPEMTKHKNEISGMKEESIEDSNIRKVPSSSSFLAELNYYSFSRKDIFHSVPF